MERRSIYQNADRFARVQTQLKPNIIYTVVKLNMSLSTDLLNVINILAYPESSDNELCCLCKKIYSDKSEHLVMRCEALVLVRNMFWDSILDHVSCQCESDLLTCNRPKQKFLKYYLVDIGVFMSLAEAIMLLCYAKSANTYQI